MLGEGFTRHGREKPLASWSVQSRGLDVENSPPDVCNCWPWTWPPKESLGRTQQATVKPCVGLRPPRLRGHPEYRFPRFPLFNHKDVFQRVFCKHQCFRDLVVCKHQLSHVYCQKQFLGNSVFTVLWTADWEEKSFREDENLRKTLERPNHMDDFGGMWQIQGPGHPQSSGWEGDQVENTISEWGNEAFGNSLLPLPL